MVHSLELHVNQTAEASLPLCHQRQRTPAYSQPSLTGDQLLTGSLVAALFLPSVFSKTPAVHDFSDRKAVQSTQQLSVCSSSLNVL